MKEHKNHILKMFLFIYILTNLAYSNTENVHTIYVSQQEGTDADNDGSDMNRPIKTLARARYIALGTWRTTDKFQWEPSGITQTMGIETFELYQNYPNPFNPKTTIKYKLYKSSRVILKIYNLVGHELETLVNCFQTAGEHEVIWDGKDIQGIQVPSGVYFCRIQTDEYIKILKLTLIR